jgi:hypothetical protein
MTATIDNLLYKRKGQTGAKGFCYKTGDSLAA